MANDLDDIDEKTFVDAYGQIYYVTEDGKRIAINNEEEARNLKKLEDHMRFYNEFPMGMK